MTQADWFNRELSEDLAKAAYSLLKNVHGDVGDALAAVGQFDAGDDDLRGRKRMVADLMALCSGNDAFACRVLVHVASVMFPREYESAVVLAARWLLELCADDMDRARAALEDTRERDVFPDAKMN